MEERVLLHGGSSADSLAAYLPPRHDLVQRCGFLTAPTTGDPRQVALVGYLADHAADLGLTPADVSQALVTDQYTDPDTGTTHIYLRQTYNGLEVANANMNINLTSDNRVINVGGGFVPGLTSQVKASIAAAPTVTALQALQGAASGLGLNLATPPSVAGDLGGAARAMVLQARDLSLDPRDGRITVLTRSDPPLWDFRASESPDGAYVAFCRAKTGGSPAIWVMEADGKHPRPITRGVDDLGADHPRRL